MLPPKRTIAVVTSDEIGSFVCAMCVAGKHPYALAEDRSDAAK